MIFCFDQLWTNRSLVVAIMFVVFLHPNRPEILHAVELQQQRFHLARGHDKHKESMDLVLLALYTSMPPARAMEIRTLQIHGERECGPFERSDYPEKNVLVIDLEDKFTLLIQKFKTDKSRPADRIPLVIVFVATYMIIVLPHAIITWHSSLSSNLNIAYKTPFL